MIGSGSPLSAQPIAPAGQALIPNASQVRALLQDVSRRLQTIELGTVLSDSTSAAEVVVSLDSDPGQRAVRVVALDRLYYSGDRVFVLIYPPAGMVCLGTVTAAPPEPPPYTPTDSGWIAPTLLNSWVNLGSSWGEAAYRKIDNQVFLRGLVRNGVTNTIFNLPAGFRPIQHVMFAGVTEALAATAAASGIANPNITGSASTGTLHTHNLSSHTHTAGAVESLNAGCRIDILNNGDVGVQASASHTFVGIWGSFFID